MIVPIIDYSGRDFWGVLPRGFFTLLIGEVFPTLKLLRVISLDICIELLGELFDIDFRCAALPSNWYQSQVFIWVQIWRLTQLEW